MTYIFSCVLMTLYFSLGGKAINSVRVDSFQYSIAFLTISLPPVLLNFLYIFNKMMSYKKGVAATYVDFPASSRLFVRRKLKWQDFYHTSICMCA